MQPSLTIGLDIVRVQRFERHIDDEVFLRRIFTLDELTQIPDGSSRAERMAGRWAAKEAVAKALGCGFGANLSFLDVEVLRNDGSAPQVKLSDFAARRHGRPQIQVSITHDGDYAAAVATVLRTL